jgi:methyl halide transferase
MDSQASDLTSDFWENRYQEGSDRWDLGQPAPPFVSLLQSPHAPQPGKIAVLGCGRGHDALLFARHGFEVFGFDFAPSALQAATAAAAQLSNGSARFLQRDIFELDQEFSSEFDYVLEHTCFCAIALNLRPAYVQLVHRLLRPHGELIALFWAHTRSGGPPFGTTRPEIEALFTPKFDFLSWEQAQNSVEGRKDEEYLVRLRAKLL